MKGWEQLERCFQDISLSFHTGLFWLRSEAAFSTQLLAAEPLSTGYHSGWDSFRSRSHMASSHTVFGGGQSTYPSLASPLLLLTPLKAVPLLTSLESSI